MMLVMLLSGCGRDDSAPPPSDQPQTPRIVSLSPAISRTLVDLGEAAQIVGRTPFCDSVDAEIPVVGDLLNLDYERLVRLRPTHVLVQPPAMGIDRQLLVLAEQHGWTIGRWRLDDVADVKRMLEQLPEVLGKDELYERAVELELLVDDALRPSDDLWRGSVLLIAGTDPVGVFGTGTYLHDVLTALGATNAVSLAHYPQLTLEDVTRINPQAMILVRPGAPEEIDPIAALRTLAALQVDAVRDGRVAILRHPDAFTPSTGIIGVAEDLRAILRSFNTEAAD